MPLRPREKITIDRGRVVFEGFVDPESRTQFGMGERFEVRGHFLRVIHTEPARFVCTGTIKEKSFPVGDVVVLKGIPLRVEGRDRDWIAFTAPIRGDA